MNIYSKIKAKVLDERGSLTILSTSLFMLLVVSSFLILNASSAYLAKRELVQVGEELISKAAHHLDSISYYSNSQNPSSSISMGSDPNSFNPSSTYTGGASGVLPIDCSSAYQTFINEISGAQLRGNPIHFDSWNCDGSSVSAKVSSQIKHLLVTPILGSDSSFLVTATISAINRLQGAN